MTDAQRFRLLASYRTPRVRIGTVLTCEYRDCDVIVTGYTDALIPWPVGRRKGKPARGPILFGALARAVRRESNQAVAHWFGVGPEVVSKWRKTLGVGLSNAGTNRLRSAYTAEPWAVAARKKGQAKGSDPERRRKLSLAFKGRVPPPHVFAAARRALANKPVSAETRAKLRAARRVEIANGTFRPPGGRPWTAAEDKLVRTLSAPAAARQVRRTLTAVYVRRVRLGVEDGRASNGRRPTKTTEKRQAA